MNTAGAGVASRRVSTNQSYLLNKITADGSETHYEYRGSSPRAHGMRVPGRIGMW